MINLFKKRGKPFLILDIGTEAVKSLIVRKEGKKIVVLGTGIHYFGKYGLPRNDDFGMDAVCRAISGSIQQASRNFVIVSEKKDLKKLPVLISLSADILKSRIIWQRIEREKESRISKSEEERILQEVRFKAKKDISLKFSKESGILPSHLHWVKIKVIETKINGYSVSRFSGCNGRDLEIKVLGIFLAKQYFKIIQKIADKLELKIPKIVYLDKGLTINFSKKLKNAVFVDIGGSVSQIIVLKQGVLERINEFKIGGQIFSKALSEALGIDYDSARVLKHKYANGLLSREVEQRIKNIFLEEKVAWDKKFGQANVYVFGGSSLLPEIKTTVIYPKHLKDIKDLTGGLTSPQFVPALLASYYGREIF